jgi:predicted ATPase
VLQQIIAKTDGVPLFVEELTKAILESGRLTAVAGHYALTGSFSTCAIPATLQDSLMARLDRLVTAKAVAQYAAVIGRQFPYALLQAVAPLEEALLQQKLGRLVEAEIVYQRGVPPQATYTFKHALIQDAAYQSLLKSTRHQYHQRIAQVLEERFPDMAQTQPELLAHHYTEAGLGGQAMGYWQRAGERALQGSANVEAVSHLTKGLEVLKTLPETPERAQQELDVQITLGSALMHTKGQATPEVEHAYTRARELCRQVGETPQLFSVLWGLRRFYFARAELQTARELAEQLLRLTQRLHTPAFRVWAHQTLGSTLFFLGELAPARAHLEQGMVHYDPQQRSHAFRYGQDAGVACLSLMARALWLLGYPDQALQRSHEALALAQELSHPASLAFAQDFAAMVYQLRREGQAAQKQAEAVMAHATGQGFPFRFAQGMMLYGWALAQQGQGEVGIAQICQGLVTHRATGAELARPYYLALLAEAYGARGQPEEGLRVLAEALAAVEKTEERFYEAELYRLRGELLQAAGSGDEAEVWLQRALDVARRQQAKSLELRAAMSLARLWQQQGKRDEAHDLLAPVYHWFTEGFDTADLQEAKALLDALSEGR